MSETSRLYGEAVIACNLRIQDLDADELRRRDLRWKCAKCGKTLADSLDGAHIKACKSCHKVNMLYSAPGNAKEAMEDWAEWQKALSPHRALIAEDRSLVCTKRVFTTKHNLSDFSGGVLKTKECGARLVGVAERGVGVCRVCNALAMHPYCSLDILVEPSWDSLLPPREPRRKVRTSKT